MAARAGEASSHLIKYTSPLRGLDSRYTTYTCVRHGHTEWRGGWGRGGLRSPDYFLVYLSTDLRSSRQIEVGRSSRVSTQLRPRLARQGATSYFTDKARSILSLIAIPVAISGQPADSSGHRSREGPPGNNLIGSHAGQETGICLRDPRD